ADGPPGRRRGAGRDGPRGRAGSTGPMSGAARPGTPDEAMRHVHFIAIGGAGMSGIARIMLRRGITVSGSDAQDSPMLKRLAELGARVFVGHSAEHLGDADTVVVATAIRESNPELRAARERGLRVLHR